MAIAAKPGKYLWRYPKGPTSGFSKWAWHNGKYVPWDEATVHVRSETAMRGINVFEGIRGYWSKADNELYIFRLDAHMERLAYSAKIIHLIPHYSEKQIVDALIGLIKKNRIRDDLHIRPMIYLDVGDFAFFEPDEIYTGATINVTVRQTMLPNNPGIHCCVSSWSRLTDNSQPPRANVGANYINSRLAAIEARLNGYDSAILLNHAGEVTEGPGASVMMARKGKIISPAVYGDVLEGITQDTVIELFRKEIGVEVVERPIDRTELYLCDELFFIGTGGGEITPILSMDKRPVGKGEAGPLTRALQKTYHQAVIGKNKARRSWLTPVYNGGN